MSEPPVLELLRAHDVRHVHAHFGFVVNTSPAVFQKKLPSFFVVGFPEWGYE
jgi:hypothetical protein